MNVGKRLKPNVKRKKRHVMVMAAIAIIVRIMGEMAQAIKVMAIVTVI